MSLLDNRRFQSVLTALCGLSLVLCYVPGLSVFGYISVAFGSVFAMRSAWASIRDREMDVNILMVLAALGAIVIGHADDAAALLFLFSLSSTLEVYAMARTKSAIEGLVKLRPDSATLITTDGERVVPLAEIRSGNLLRVLAFNGFPADGIVTEGRSHANMSIMTGESEPVSVEVGSKVLAGTENQEGMLIMKVTAQPGDSTLDKVVALVEDAQQKKASGEKIGAWFGKGYTWFVLIAFACSLLIRVALGATWGASLGASITLLVALSPCALVIATPATTLSALTWAARHGILVRGGEFIERAGMINVVAMDKTGTLTLGKPRLHEICLCTHTVLATGEDGLCKDSDSCWSGQGEISADAKQILRYAAAAEQYSTHPLAMAVVDGALEHGLDVPEATAQTVVPARGVEATVDSVRVKVGQLKFFTEHGAELPHGFIDHVHEIQHQGMTVAIVSAGNKFAALGIRDGIRTESKATIRQLKTLGVEEIIMLTGDTPQTAEAIAAEAGLTKFHASLMPQDKTDLIQKQVDAGKNVMMVGDGVNDGPSLAMASVGVAMGGVGSDVALNAADVVLMRDNLSQIPELISLGKRTNRIVIGNLYFAGGMIVTLTALSFTGKLPLPIAVLGHEGSTVLVILNGLRLLGGPTAIRP